MAVSASSLRWFNTPPPWHDSMPSEGGVHPIVALSFRGIGARLAAKPREHATRARATTPESPTSLQAPTVPVSAEPHHGIFTPRSDFTRAFTHRPL